MSSMYEQEYDVAVEAVRKASALCRRVREDFEREEALTKADRSPVTVADFGSQAVVLDALARAFPDDPVVAEEDATALRGEEHAAIRRRVVESVIAEAPHLDEHAVPAAIDRGRHEGGMGRFWTLDPIDGTKGFIRGDQYAVALALIEDGRVVLGVLGCPNLPLDASDPSSAVGCLFAAIRGRGTRASALIGDEWSPVAVAAVTEPSAAVLCESMESGHTAHGASARIAETLGVQADPVRMDSQCKYAAVARGEASIYLRLPTRADYQEKIWDHAAGAMVIEEAGGRVTDLSARPLDFSQGRTLSRNRGIVATNGPLHPAVLAAL